DAQLIEMLRCDPSAARTFVEANLRAANDPAIERVRLLGMLGRRDDAIALFDRLTEQGTRATAEAWERLAFAAPERAGAGLQKGLEESRREGQDDDWVTWGFSLARALEATGRTAEAKALWAEIPDRSLDLEGLAEKAASR